MISNFELNEQAAQLPLSIRTFATVQDLPHVIGEAYGKIGRFMENQGIEIKGVPFTAYFNLDMQNLDLEIGFQT